MNPCRPQVISNAIGHFRSVHLVCETHGFVAEVGGPIFCEGPRDQLYAMLHHWQYHCLAHASEQPPAPPAEPLPLHCL